VANWKVGKEDDPCVYCGLSSTDWDHVIPDSYCTKTPLVRACSECNSLASDGVFPTIEEKQLHIKIALRRRYGEVLKKKSWTKDELSELAPRLQAEALEHIAARRVTFERLAHAIPFDVLEALEIPPEVLQKDAPRFRETKTYHPRRRKRTNSFSKKIVCLNDPEQGRREFESISAAIAHYGFDVRARLKGYVFRGRYNPDKLKLANTLEFQFLERSDT